MRALAVVLASMLASCGAFEPAAKVDDRRRAEIEAAVSKEYGYRAPLTFIGNWHASGDPSSFLACGEFKSPPEFGGDPASIRYVYDLDRKHVTIEMHRLWTTRSVISQAILDANRRIFDKLWADNCARYRPGRWT